MHRITKVFISAVSRDLKSYRLACRDELLTGGVHPVSMDAFPPGSEQLIPLLRERIATCDAVVCLVGFAYGAEPLTAGPRRRSYSQLEYDVASEMGKPIFLFLAGDAYTPDAGDSEPEELRVLQGVFRRQLEADGHRWSEFHSTDQLRLLVAQTVPALLRHSRADAIPFGYLGPPRPPAYFAGRSRELHQLADALQPSRPAVIAVLGMGGQGKTTLVMEWLRTHTPPPFDAGYWCSAYRGAFTFDAFIDAALSYFEPAAFDKRQIPRLEQRVARLLVHLQRRQSLLVIEGVERWLRGWARDHIHEVADSARERDAQEEAFDSFLEAAAALTNGSHVVLTSRALPACLDSTSCTLIPMDESGGARPLEGLDEPAAVELLRQLSMPGSEGELRQLSREYGHHPLALEVLASMARRGKRAHAMSGRSRSDPEVRLNALLDEARRNLPDGRFAERFMCAAACSIEDPHLDTVIVAAEFARRWPWPLPESWSRWFGPPDDHAVAGQRARYLEMAHVLAEWNLLRLTSNGDTVQLHPVVRTFFAERNRRRVPMHRVLSTWYSRQPIIARPRTLEDVRPRVLALEHALRAGDEQTGATLLFGSLTEHTTLAEWLSAWGHQTETLRLLQPLNASTNANIAALARLSSGTMSLEVRRPHDALAHLNAAVITLERLAAGRHAMWQQNLARALATRGAVYRDLGYGDRALDDLTGALAHMEASLADHAQLRDLVRTRVSRASVNWETGRWTEAHSDLDRAVQLLADHGEARDGELLGSIHLARGNVFADQRNLTAAMSEMEMAASCYRAALTEGHEYLTLAAARAETVRELTRAQLGDATVGVEGITVVLQTLEALVRDGRQDAEWALAVAYLDLAVAQLLAGSAADAVGSASVAVDRYRRFYSEGGVQFAGLLAHALMTRAEALYIAGDPASSERDLAEGLQLFERLVVDHRHQSDYVVYQLRTLARAVAYLASDATERAQALSECLLRALRGVRDDARSTEGPHEVATHVLRDLLTTAAACGLRIDAEEVARLKDPRHHASAHGGPSAGS
jgi:tetratricopeptide (TPR) repeat protein